MPTTTEIRQYAIDHGISDYEALKKLSAEQAAPTPITDAATDGVDYFVTDSDQRAYSATDYECLRDEMRKLERELAFKTAECARLREALKPFANYACVHPCNCHNCVARAVLKDSGNG